MVDYNICKGINPFYFDRYAAAQIALPEFFDEYSPEGETIKKIKSLMAQNQFAAAAQIAEQALQSAPDYAQIGFLAWQVFAFWKDGRLPDAEMMNYFSTFEEIYAQEALINFNKSVLHVKAKNFPDAVKELKTALKKDPNNAPAQTLLFWIYYFSGDTQSKQLFFKLDQGKHLNEQMINLIKIVESVQTKQTSPLYNAADTTNTKDSNDALFKKFPNIEILKAPTKENILMVAADTNYLREYVTTLILSADELADKDLGIHIHVYNPLGTDIDLLNTYAADFSNLNLSVSYEKSSLTLNSDAPSYYASMRFCRAYQIYSQFDCVKKIAITDADSLIRKNPFLHTGISSHDITLTGHDPAPPWDKFAAGFSVFSKDPVAQDAFAQLTNILLKNFSEQKEFWFIDQVALLDVFSRFEKSGKILRMPLDEIFGTNMEHTDAAWLWTYTNEHKVRDNPMNRERRRLIEKYNIQLEWNSLVRGKYGYVLANKNDDFIGRSLLTHGSWCDHEVKYMRHIINHGDTVIEVGSNMGSHTVPLAKAVGSMGRLYAIEPQRLMFQTMCANVALNSLSNVYTLNVGCGESPSTLHVDELDPTAKQNFGGFRLKESTGQYAVPIITIDSLNIPSCKLIKMDVEGMELDVMKGAINTLKTLEPVLFFESHGEAVFEIDTFLKSIGYTVYDFAIPNDPMYLATTQKHDHLAQEFGISPLSRS